MSYRKYLMTDDVPPSELYKTVKIDTDLDTISRQAAIDALRAMQTYKLFAGDDMLLIDQAGAQTELMMLPPAQPELIEKAAYIRGFEQGRTQGMIDSQGGKK